MVLVIVLLLILLFGGGWGYHRRADYGPAPYSAAWLVFVVLLVLLLMGRI